MAPTVTPIYAAALAALFVILSMRVIGLRFRRRVSLGDGGDAELMQRIRAQANCAEYAPFGVLLLLIAELTGAPVWALHLSGLCLLAGRMAHGIALSGRMRFTLRKVGMVLTFASLCLSAILGLT